MIEQVINKWLSEMKRDLISNYDKLGLRASGDWAKSLEEFQKISDSTIKAGILGNDYTVYLEQGRRPNRNQSPEALRAWVGYAGSTFLKEWVDKKGINVNPYAVAWKIAREGWEVPNRHNKGGLVSDVVNRSKMIDLIRSIGNYFISSFRSDVINKFK